MLGIAPYIGRVYMGYTKAKDEKRNTVVVLLLMVLSIIHVDKVTNYMKEI
jgi:hypothetical protein